MKSERRIKTLTIFGPNCHNTLSQEQSSGFRDSATQTHQGRFEETNIDAEIREREID